MNDKMNLPASVEIGQQTIAAESPQPVPELRKPTQAKLVSEAALRRELAKGLAASFAADSFWDFIGVAGGLYFVLAPLRKELGLRSQRYRGKPDAFLESCRRLVQRRRLTYPEYDRKFQWLSHYASRLNTNSQPATAEGQNPKLTKYQRRKMADMGELVRSFLPFPGRIPSDEDAKKAFKLLTDLRKTGGGRRFDEELQRAMELLESGVRGYTTIARKLRPDVAAREKLGDLAGKGRD